MTESAKARARVTPSYRPLSEVGELLSSRLNYLMDASQILVSSLDQNEVFSRLASLVVPFMADWCSFNVVDPDSSEVRTIGLRHLDSEIERLLKESASSLPLGREVGTGIAEVIRTGKPLPIQELDPLEFLKTLFSENDLKRIGLDVIRRADIKSYLGIPLISDGVILGGIAMVRGAQRVPFDRMDLAVGEELARRASTALSILNRLDHAISEHDRLLQVLSLYENFLLSRLEDAKAPLTAARLQAEMAAKIPHPPAAEHPFRRLLHSIPGEIDRTVAIISSLQSPRDKVEELMAQLPSQKKRQSL